MHQLKRALGLDTPTKLSRYFLVGLVATAGVNLLWVLSVSEHDFLRSPCDYFVALALCIVYLYFLACFLAVVLTRSCANVVTRASRVLDWVAFLALMLLFTFTCWRIWRTAMPKKQKQALKWQAYWVLGLNTLSPGLLLGWISCRTQASFETRVAPGRVSMIRE